MKKLVLIFASLLFLFSIPMQGQDGDAKGKSDAAPKDVRLTIIVTGGPDNKPVENASIYVKYVEERKLAKNKKIEMNLKSNISGVCHVPVIPPGRFLVKVIAEGWKTYGEYFDISQNEQTINITLARPPKWY